MRDAEIFEQEMANGWIFNLIGFAAFLKGHDAHKG